MLTAVYALLHKNFTNENLINVENETIDSLTYSCKICEHL